MLLAWVSKLLGVDAGPECSLRRGCLTCSCFTLSWFLFVVVFICISRARPPPPLSLPSPSLSLSLSLSFAMEQACMAGTGSEVTAQLPFGYPPFGLGSLPRSSLDYSVKTFVTWLPGLFPVRYFFIHIGAPAPDRTSALGF